MCVFLGGGSLSPATSEWDQGLTNSEAEKKVCSHVKGFLSLWGSLLLVGQVCYT